MILQSCIDFFDARLKHQLGQLMRLDMSTTSVSVRFYLGGLALAASDLKLNVGGDNPREIATANLKAWDAAKREIKSLAAKK